MAMQVPDKCFGSSRPFLTVSGRPSSFFILLRLDSSMLSAHALRESLGSWHTDFSAAKFEGSGCDLPMDHASARAVDIFNSVH